MPRSMPSNPYGGGPGVGHLVDRGAEEVVEQVLVANVDVVGHIENEPAVNLAVEAVDYQIGALVQAAENAGYTTIVTADPGCLMQMRELAGNEGQRFEHLATILEEGSR